MIIISKVWYDWEESIEIIEYCEKNNLEYQIKEDNEISQMTGDHVYFCNYDVRKYSVVDTYDEKYNKFYKRMIGRYNVNDLIFIDKFFMKPIDDKIFDGIIIDSDKMLNEYKQIYKNINVYMSEYINIKSEYRLLIGDNKLYDSCLIKGEEICLDNNFIQELLDITENYLCIDIGYNNEWFIVEINPPFSIEQYDININSYMQFCIDSSK